MNILVTGANGQLGNEMRIIAQSSTDQFLFTDVNQVEGHDTVYLDITSKLQIQQIVTDHHISCIVNCAAYTNVDAAEDNMDIAEKLNATAPQYLAEVMYETGGLLVHISTDYVFGKEPYNKPCKENQKGTPTGVYGLTKLHGEQAIVASGCKYVIIRTAWLYSEFGKNFVKTMLALTASKPELKVVFDQVGTPTYALDLAETIMIILNEYKSNPVEFSHSGTYHYSNEGVCSWFDFTKMIQTYAAQVNSHRPMAIITPCHSNEFPSKVVRPAFSVLDKTKIKDTFGINIPYWTDSLQICINNILHA